MKRYVFALIVAVVAVSAAAAQPPVIPEPPKKPEPRPPFPPARWMFTPTPGIYNWDSGEYLLGGTQGLSRSIGMWTMQPGVAGPGVDSSGGYWSCLKCGHHLHR